MESENEATPPEDPENLSGCFLVSEIALGDPNFRNTVVLMITHDDKGALGLVVNRPSPFSLGDLVEGLDGTAAASIPVFVGGPVQQEVLFVLHSTLLPEGPHDGEPDEPIEGVFSEPATRPLVDYLKGDWSSLAEEERPDVRVFAGYSGWGPGQVEGELKAETWVVIPATREIVFTADAAGAWADAFARKGPLYQIILQTGFKPSMN
jgi:putative transcriptional regulator